MADGIAVVTAQQFLIVYECRRRAVRDPLLGSYRWEGRIGDFLVKHCM